MNDEWGAMRPCIRVEHHLPGHHPPARPPPLQRCGGGRCRQEGRRVCHPAKAGLPACPSGGADEPAGRLPCVGGRVSQRAGRRAGRGREAGEQVRCPPNFLPAPAPAPHLKAILCPIPLSAASCTATQRRACQLRRPPRCWSGGNFLCRAPPSPTSCGRWLQVSTGSRRPGE